MQYDQISITGQTFGLHETEVDGEELELSENFRSLSPMTMRLSSLLWTSLMFSMSSSRPRSGLWSSLVPL